MLGRRFRVCARENRKTPRTKLSPCSTTLSETKESIRAYIGSSLSSDSKLSETMLNNCTG